MTAHAKVAGAIAARQRISLDGTWEFRLGEHGELRQAQVPGPWQAEFLDLHHASGTGIYRRRFARPEGSTGREVALVFGAVNYFAEVLVNGRLLGSHEGGYLPFEVVVPEGLLEADNLLEVRATLPTADAAAYPDFPFPEIPHGKQSWYGPLGGIWQSVDLEVRDRRHIAHLGVTAEPQAGLVRLALELSAAAEGGTVRVEIRDPDGAVVAEGETRAVSGRAALALVVAAPRLWSPASPALYAVHAALTIAGEAVDAIADRFGFRTVEARDGKLFLNGEPFYMRGALDQDYYPVGICTPPSRAFIEDQFRKAKELGLNLLRCHIKVPDPRYYEVADEMGLLVWTEIPNVQSFTEASARRLRETMDGILRRDGNHPSIITWTIINEDWGTRLVENAEHRAWLKDTYDWLKAKDPTRLVVDNSACIPNFHVKTDINDYHYYRSVPERRAEWDKLTAEFAAGADWTYSPHGDAERRGDEPLVVSEFGVWGLPSPAELANADGSEPFWFESGPGWGDGAAYPHAIEKRFAAYHLDRVFGSFDRFIDAVQWYQFGNLKYEIESMRAQAPIVGYVITEMTDVHWEANGLLDINRNPRAFHHRFAEINADRVILAAPARHAGTAGDRLEIALSVATGGLDLPEGALLAWSVPGGESGEIAVAQAGPLAVVPAGSIAPVLPEAAAGRQIELEFTLRAGGRELARNRLAIAVYRRRAADGLPPVHAADPAVAEHLRGLGYRVVAAEEASVHVVRGLDAGDIEAMRDGARYLVLADGKAATHGNLRLDAPAREQPFMPIVDDVPGQPMGPDALLPNIGLQARQGTMWRGDWIASFSWLRRDGIFAEIPGGPLFDLSFDGVVPRHVMTGFRPFEFEGTVHAALVVGWIHKPAVLLGERRVGRGRLVATTFRLLEEAPGADPAAAALLDASLRLAAGQKGGSSLPNVQA